MTRNSFLQWLIDDVPPELAACESDCRNTRCESGHFAVCPVRLAEKQAIEQLKEVTP